MAAQPLTTQPERLCHWERMKRYVDKWLPVARIYHPYPDERFGVMTQGRSPVR